MDRQVEAAFEEMMDISTDIANALMFGPTGILASNMTEEAQDTALAQAQQLITLGETRSAEMGSQPFTQLVIDSTEGYVFLARELGEQGMAVLATGKKGSRVGLVLYDLKTCLRDAREALNGAAIESAEEGEE